MLELHNISVKYYEETVLNDVSLSFRPGELLAIIGPNGSGKSTLLKASCALIPVFSGQITLNGELLSSYSRKELACRVSYLPQSRDVPDITVRSLVLHGRFPHLSWPRRIGEEDRKIAQRALEAVDAEDLSDRLLQELSGGQRQKAYIAMALAQQTDTILLDEPTTFLDIAHQIQITRLARSLAQQGKAVGIVLHDITHAMETADRIAVLSEGRIEAIGTPEEIYNSGVLSRVFKVSIDCFESGTLKRYICGREVL